MGHSWDPLGVLLTHSWVLLGKSWGCLTGMMKHMLVDTSLWRFRARLWGLLGASLEPLTSLLGGSWGFLVPLGSLLVVSWELLGAFCGS